MVHPATDASHACHLDESILNSIACAAYAADATQRHGAVSSLELSHSGMFAGTYMTDKKRPKSLLQWSAPRLDKVAALSGYRPLRAGDRRCFPCVQHYQRCV